MQTDLTEENKSWDFYTIVWWLLSVGLIFASRFEQLNQVVLKILIPLLFLAVVFKTGSIASKSKGLNLYFILFLWACLSTIYTVNMPSTINYLEKMLGNVIIWFIVSAVVINAKDIYNYLVPLFLVSLLHAYFGMTVSPEVVSERVVERAQGLTTNANQLGFLMWYGVVVATLLFMISKKWFFRIATLIALILFTYVLFKTGSRKSLAAFLIFFAAIAIFFLKGRGAIVMVLLAIFGAIFYNVAYDFIVQNTAVGARLGKETLEGGTAIRVDLMLEGLSFFLSSPVIGIALGSFSSFSSSGMVAHNDYIEILASMGLPALLIYLAIFYDYFKKCVYLYKSGHLPNFMIVAVGFGVGYVFLGTGRPAFVDPVAILIFGMFHGFLTKAVEDVQEAELYEEEENAAGYQHA